MVRSFFGTVFIIIGIIVLAASGSADTVPGAVLFLVLGILLLISGTKYLKDRAAVLNRAIKMILSSKKIVVKKLCE